MLKLTQTTVESKRAIIALLFKLMGADDEENPKELAFIMHIGDRLGLTDDDLKEVSFDMDKYPLQPPAAEKDRVTILYYLLFLMKADGVIRPEEEEFISHFGMKLGFRPDMIMDLISVLKKHVDKSVPAAELYSKVKTYLN